MADVTVYVGGLLICEGGIGGDVAFDALDVHIVDSTTAVAIDGLNVTVYDLQEMLQSESDQTQVLLAALVAATEKLSEDYNSVTVNPQSPAQGELTATGSLTGTYVSSYLPSDAPTYLLATGALSGEYIAPIVASVDSLDAFLTIVATLSGDAIVTTASPYANWVAWSKIGEAKFSLDLTNDSGMRPMPWKGTVLRVLPMGKEFIVYGSGGVARLSPVVSPVPTFGLKQISRYGLKYAGMVCGDDSQHYFIDTLGRLNAVNGEGVKQLGYEEFLNSLGSTTRMFLDSIYDRVFICGSSVGYTYTSSGLGGGVLNMTGLSSEDTTLPSMFAGTSNYPSYGVFSLITHDIDFGVSCSKVLQKIEVSTDYPENLEFCIDYDPTGTEGWTTTGWTQLTSRGEGFVYLTAVTFRVRLRTLTTPATDVINNNLADLTSLSHLSGNYLPDGVPITRLDDIIFQVLVPDTYYSYEEAK